jgi:hypothetical protein
MFKMHWQNLHAILLKFNPPSNHVIETVSTAHHQAQDKLRPQATASEKAWDQRGLQGVDLAIRH